MKVLKQVYNLSHCILQPYDGIEDIPEQDVPVVLITKPNTETSVKKCGGKSYFIPTISACFQCKHIWL